MEVAPLLYDALTQSSYGSNIGGMKRLIAIAFLLLTNVSWGSCPSGQEENDRTGHCEPVGGVQEQNASNSTFETLTEGYCYRHDKNPVSRHDRISGLFQFVDREYCEAWGGVLFDRRDCALKDRYTNDAFCVKTKENENIRKVVVEYERRKTIRKAQLRRDNILRAKELLSELGYFSGKIDQAVNPTFVSAIDQFVQSSSPGLATQQTILRDALGRKHVSEVLLQALKTAVEQTDDEAARQLAKKKAEEEAARLLAKKKAEDEAARLLAQKKAEEEAARLLAKKKAEEDSAAQLARAESKQNAAAMVDISLELEFWQAIKDSDDPDEYQVYLDEFPTGKFSKLAKLRIKKLDGATEAANSSVPDLNYGQYHALVIGNNDYTHLPKLKTAVNDADAVTSLLKNEYGFSVRLLKNANRSEMLGSLAAFRKVVGRDDNFLLYYAGHGYLDEAVNEGYWLPVDAERDDPSNWLQNDTIVTQLKGMQAKHVMVVADSCFSGTMTRGLKMEQRTPDWLQRMVKKKARTALTSGGVEPVSDSGGGGHSIFASIFSLCLRRTRR